MKYYRLIMLFFVLFMSCDMFVFGQETLGAKSKIPQTNIKCSGPMNVDYQENVAVFHDDVVVDDPQFMMWADEMTVTFDSGMQNIRKVVAVGAVRIQKEDRKAKSEHAVYTVDDGRIELTGNPLVKKGEDVLSGDKITFFRNDNRMLIEPKAKLIIYSEDPGNADDGFF